MSDGFGVGGEDYGHDESLDVHDAEHNSDDERRPRRDGGGSGDPRGLRGRRSGRSARREPDWWRNQACPSGQRNHRYEEKELLKRRDLEIK